MRVAALFMPSIHPFDSVMTLFCLVRPAGRTHLEVQVLYLLGKEKS